MGIWIKFSFTVEHNLNPIERTALHDHLLLSDVFAIVPLEKNKLLLYFSIESEAEESAFKLISLFGNKVKVSEMKKVDFQTNDERVYRR